MIIQNNVADDVGQILMWHDIIRCWCGYLTCYENWFKWFLVSLVYIVRVDNNTFWCVPPLTIYDSIELRLTTVRKGNSTSMTCISIGPWTISESALEPNKPSLPVFILPRPKFECGRRPKTQSRPVGENQPSSHFAVANDMCRNDPLCSSVSVAYDAHGSHRSGRTTDHVHGKGQRPRAPWNLDPFAIRSL
jgi:hypothetical protein